MDPEMYSHGINDHDVYDAEGDVYGTWDGCKEALHSLAMSPVSNPTRDHALLRAVYTISTCSDQ